MAYLLRGALIEYGSGLIGPIPNVVIFQFNPESLNRTLQVPQRPSGASARESTQAGERTVEKIVLKAQFSAADMLGENKALARLFGISPQISALEKMAIPSSKLAGLAGEAINAIKGAVGAKKDPTQPIPREKFPRILFLWGLTRVLPVTIESMSINEMEFDPLLNPIRADVDIGLAVHPPDPDSGDKIAQGALTYTNLATEAKAAANLINTAQQIRELIPF